MRLSTRYDALFREHLPVLPLAYARALAYRESRLNPRNLTPPDAGPDRGARGLYQVMTVNREDFNKRHGTSWGPDAMFDAALNTRVFAGTLERMLRVYRQLGLVGEKPRTREQLLLVTAGWNSGYGDVKRIAEWLIARGRPVTHAALFESAPLALPLSSQRRWTAAKRRWQQSVVELAESATTEGGTNWAMWGLLLLIAQSRR